MTIRRRVSKQDKLFVLSSANHISWGCGDLRSLAKISWQNRLCESAESLRYSVEINRQAAPGMLAQHGRADSRVLTLATLSNLEPHKNFILGAATPLSLRPKR